MILPSVRTKYRGIEIIIEWNGNDWDKWSWLLVGLTDYGIEFDKPIDALKGAINYIDTYKEYIDERIG